MIHTIDESIKQFYTLKPYFFKKKKKIQYTKKYWKKKRLGLLYKKKYAPVIHTYEERPIVSFRNLLFPYKPIPGRNRSETDQVQRERIREVIRYMDEEFPWLRKKRFYILSRAQCIKKREKKEKFAEMLRKQREMEKINPELKLLKPNWNVFPLPKRRFSLWRFYGHYPPSMKKYIKALKKARKGLRMFIHRGVLLILLFLITDSMTFIKKFFKYIYNFYRFVILEKVIKTHCFVIILKNICSVNSYLLIMVIYNIILIYKGLDFVKNPTFFPIEDCIIEENINVLNYNFMEEFLNYKYPSFNHIVIDCKQKLQSHFIIDIIKDRLHCERKDIILFDPMTIVSPNLELILVNENNPDDKPIKVICIENTLDYAREVLKWHKLFLFEKYTGVSLYILLKLAKIIISLHIYIPLQSFINDYMLFKPRPQQLLGILDKPKVVFDSRNKLLLNIILGGFLIFSIWYIDTDTIVNFLICE